MSFDFEECETKFETQRKQLESRIAQIQKLNDQMVTQRSLKSEQLSEIKEEMKQELQAIKFIVNKLDSDANRDQKFLIKSLKQKLQKCEEQHKILIQQLLNTSISSQFDRLSLKESQVIASNSCQDKYFVDESPSSIPNSLPSDKIPKVSPSKKSSQLSQSLQKPLIENESEEMQQRSSLNKESDEIEQEAAQQLNEEYIKYQNLKAEQENLEKYNKEIDQLVTFDESGKKCFKYSIISAISLVLLGTATFLIIHYLYK